MERGWKPNVEISPSCPRCGSSNTKFCYYNNYSLTQPRYFCKGCRRYWTKGGSLRNVPVGGGCRKNRRSGKSLRLSNEFAGHHHRSFGNEPLRDSFVHRGISSVEPSSSSMNINPDGSHIDLALVYANFLNQQQDTKNSTTGFEMAELPGEFDPSLPFTSISSTNSLEPTVPLLEENGLAGCFTVSELRMEAPLSDNDQLMYYCGLDSAHKHQDRIPQYTSHRDTHNYGLPPLPGEDVACHDQDILWSNSHMKDDHHSLQVTQQPGLEQDPNLLFGNWSSFGLSSDDPFPRT